MPSVIVSRSDLFPPGTSAGIYPGTSKPPGGVGPPGAPAIASATVAAGGTLTVTDAGILQGVGYQAYAQVGGENRYVRVRSSLDVTDTGKAVGTGDTASGSASLANVTATSGAFAIGQRVTGPGIPPGTYLIAGSGASWTMSDKATATASTVALEGHGRDRWRAKVMQRRAAIGTS
jgi:hypothetical protein